MKTRQINERVACGRCGGFGQWCGGACFKCGGYGKHLTARARMFRAELATIDAALAAGKVAFIETGAEDRRVEQALKQRRSEILAA